MGAGAFSVWGLSKQVEIHHDRTQELFYRLEKQTVHLGLQTAELQRARFQPSKPTPAELRKDLLEAIPEIELAYCFTFWSMVFGLGTCVMFVFQPSPGPRQ